MKKRLKRIIPFIFAATVCLFLGGLHTRADAKLYQIDGQEVTDVGQQVQFAGTNGYRGEWPPGDHRADTTDKWDKWMVMKIEGEGENKRALIMKRRPIAVQAYNSAYGREATYNKSQIKKSVDAWWDHAKSVRLPLPDGKPAEEYVLPVILQGADQCEPCECNANAQVVYRTVDVAGGGTKQAFVPSLADVTDYNIKRLALMPASWQKFVTGASGYASSCSWLRSPLSYHNNAAIFYYGGYGNCFVHFYKCDVRPACWVRI